ncbi:hypothetical protein pfor_22c2443 [Rhodobacteraceae bacterium SB2]|nr:hypothetical protein pfor_22c2443 [Rhodobacteraceae bacterium SB2]
MRDVFAREVYNNLPRLLSLIDTDDTSESYGLGDRYYWAWGLTDFGNATFQGMAHGLSLLWIGNKWPYETDPQLFLDRIDALFIGTKKLTRLDGSLEEAFPNEGSYCVTALVAFDLLRTYSLLREEINDELAQSWLATIRPLIKYLKNADEHHALISNHLATASAALFCWHELISDVQAFAKAEILLARVLQNQSDEGWFVEYGGADPGYESLCLHYLTDIYRSNPDERLRRAIENSMSFLSYCMHPDGSFSGNYGNRYTRFIYPSSFYKFRGEISYAEKFLAPISESISNNAVVSLSCIDEPNFIPLFNSYCMALTSYDKFSEIIPENAEKLPCNSELNFTKIFPSAGLLFDKGDRHYTVVALKRGGAFYHFVDGYLKNKCLGLIIKKNTKEIYCNHHSSSINFDKQNNTITIESDFRKQKKRLPKPWQFFILRLACMTMFRIRLVREIIKSFLVWLLISQRESGVGSNTRIIKLGENLSVKDNLSIPKKFIQIQPKQAVVPIHMASKGYWQIQDEN